MKLILTYLMLLVGVHCAKAQSDSTIVSDLELELWLEQYGTAVADSTEADSTQTPDIRTTNNATLHTATDSTIVTQSDNKTNLPDSTINTTPQNAHIIIANAFSKSNTLKQNTLPQKTTKHIATTKPTNTKNSNTKKATKQNNKSTTPRPIIPNIELCKLSLISAEDSLIIHNQALHSTEYNPLFMEWVKGTAPYKSKSLTNSDSTIIALRNNAKKEVSLTEPELYEYHKSQLPKTSEIKSKNIKSTDKEKLLLNSDLLNIGKNTTIEIVGPKIPKWKPGAKFQLQATQNFISANWYKGGESNITAFLYAMGYCNYNNHNGIEWDNKLEWKLGINSTGSDSLRMLRINDDLLRLNSKLGVKAIKSFFYTAEIDFQTTLFNTYKPQTYIRTSGPFSPIRTNISVGMDYKYNNKLSIFVSPLSYKLVYVADTSFHNSVKPTESIPHQVGMENGTRMINQLGALLRIGWEHKFNESIDMELKFSFFGNYVGYRKGIETDLEIIGNFQINRFLSAKVSLNPRYDSTVPASDGEKPKLQFRELISVGFNYIL